MKQKIWSPTPPPNGAFKQDVFAKAGKVGKFVYQIGELKQLRQKSKPVKISEISTTDFRAKLNYLKQCILDYRRMTGMGRGITAVQVGVPERFSVIYMPEIKGQLLIIINPTITKKSKQLLVYPELCMSANPIIATVTRPAWIEFTYFDEQGNKQLWQTKADDKKGKMYNRVFQHEIDHMNGIINIDKVDSSTLFLESDPNFYANATFTPVKQNKQV